jgi:hypothetical protein
MRQQSCGAASYCAADDQWPMLCSYADHQEDLTRALSVVADYRAPGKYYLRSQRLKLELEGLSTPAVSEAAKEGSKSPSPKLQGVETCCVLSALSGCSI